jgi:hypothetical protein
VGQAAGMHGTVKINNWTQHLAWVVEVPDSTVPITNVDLLWSALPVYRSGKEGDENLTTGQIEDDGGISTSKRKRLSQQANLSASEVTTEEPQHPLDPEEIPVVRIIRIT